LGAVWGLGFLVSVESFQEGGEIVGGELPREGLGGRAVADLEAGEALLEESRSVKSLGDSAFRWMMKKWTSTRLSQDAWTGVCTRTVVGNCSARRSVAFAPRWDEPLSTTQNTRSAHAYGSWAMTWATSLVNGSMPVVASHRAEDPGPVDVVGGQVGQRSAAVVVVADPHHPGLACRHRWVAPAPGLD
jgi:hypothetical protein